MTRYTIISILFLLCAVQALGQVASNLVIRSTPTDKLADWATDNSIITYIANNLLEEPYKVVIKTELKLTDGTVIATKDLARSTVYTLAQGNNIFYARDVFPLEVMMFTGSYQNALAQTGRLPAGYYQLTVQLVYAQGYAPLTKVATVNFLIHVVKTQLPVLMKPYKEEILNYTEAQTAIIFRWTPKMPRTQELAKYHIQVFEVLSNQQPVQALRANQPILDITVKGQTQYIWRPQLPFDENSKKFIWSIQLLDYNDEPLTTSAGNTEGRSEPSIFYIAKKVVATDEEEE